MNNELKKAIIELWLISRTALADTVPCRYDRMQYVKKELIRTYPTLIAGISPKQVWFSIEETIS